MMPAERDNESGILLSTEARVTDRPGCTSVTPAPVRRGEARNACGGTRDSQGLPN